MAGATQGPRIVSTDLAPIALFVYKRPDHTLQALSHLAECDLARQSTLFIFSDGPKPSAAPQELADVKKVRAIIRQKEWAGKVVIREQAQNKGLAKSIVDGVTELCDTHGKVIVLEDDLVVSRSFLNYMNDALNKYEKNDNVFQISGYMFPVTHKTGQDAFFLPLTTTWGWATWKRAWKFFDWNPQYALEKLKDGKVRSKFNLDNSFPYAEMLEARLNNTNQSWGILFWWTVFNQNGLAVHPKKSMVNNIGFDNSGTHCSANQFQTYDVKIANQHNDIALPSEVRIDSVAFDSIRKYLRAPNTSSLYKRTANRLTMMLRRFELRTRRAPNCGAGK